MTQTDQLLPKLLSIIKLSVVNQYVFFLIPAQMHWLRAACRINHGKPGMQQANLFLLKYTAAVRTSAVHGAQHIAPGKARPIDGLKDALECRHALEQLFGRIIRGMAYPDSGITAFCNGATYAGVKQYLTQLDIVYARSLAADNNRFMMPTDWHNWIPTAHHKNPQVMDWAKQFVSIDVNSQYDPERYPRLFYLWGHTYEFDRENAWPLLEELCQTLGHKEDTWYATNMEIYEYTAAYDALIFSVDSTIIHNPTNRTVWFDQDKKLYVIHPGQTLQIT
jgi:hypothetical protein